MKSLQGINACLQYRYYRLQPRLLPASGTVRPWASSQSAHTWADLYSPNSGLDGGGSLQGQTFLELGLSRRPLTRGSTLCYGLNVVFVSLVLSLLL